MAYKRLPPWFFRILHVWQIVIILQSQLKFKVPLEFCILSKIYHLPTYYSRRVLIKCGQIRITGKHTDNLKCCPHFISRKCCCPHLINRKCGQHFFPNNILKMRTTRKFCPHSIEGKMWTTFSWKIIRTNWKFSCC